MPRRATEDDDMPRRKRTTARAIAIAEDTERGLAMRILLHSPKDMVAGALAFAAVSAIVGNALFLQAGPHPSPMFGSVITLSAPGTSSTVSPLPRPRPPEATARPAEMSPPETKVEPKPTESRSSDLKPSERSSDALTNLVKATSNPNGAPAATASIQRPPAPIPTARSDNALNPGGTKRIASVQRALTEYGYGQLKPTGTIGAETQTAIQRFERDHKLPVTGQMSDRLVRDLSAMIGHTID